MVITKKSICSSFFILFSKISYLSKKEDPGYKGPVSADQFKRTNQVRRYKDEVMSSKELLAGEVCQSAAAPATTATTATATTPAKTSATTASITPSVEYTEKHSILLCTSSYYIVFVFDQ